MTRTTKEQLIEFAGDEPEEQDKRDAERYRVIRAAGSSLKIYIYDDADDPCSGDWHYKPSPERVDEWCDSAIGKVTP